MRSIFLLLSISVFTSLVAKTPSLQDYMKARGEYYFERDLPGDIDPEQYVYLTIVGSDGSSRHIAEMPVSETGSKVKVFAFLGSERPSIALMSASGESIYRDQIEKDWTGFSADTETKGIEESLLRFRNRPRKKEGAPANSGYFELFITIGEKE